RAANNMLDRRQRSRAQRGRAVVVERGGATHDERAKRRLRSRRPTNQLPQLRLGIRGDRAAVEHRDVRVRGRRNDRVPTRFDELANRFGIVVVRPAPKGAQVHLHAGTAPLDVTRTSRCAGLIGMEKWKALPLPSPALCTQIRPPCASTTSLQKARPSPELRVRGMLGFFTRSNFLNITS